jgi:AcrR family transcriptional regulator
MAARGETRQKMLDAALAVMRERGAAGVTVDAVLARSGAPRGSVYHHFPGGRAQLIDETLTYAGQTFAGMLERAARNGSDAVLTRLVVFWTRVLEESDFRAGCPIVPTAGEAGSDGELAHKAALILGGWSRTIAAVFEAEGRTDAEALATTVLSSLSGAVSMCRAMGSVEPHFQVSEQLSVLIQSRATL